MIRKAELKDYEAICKLAIEFSNASKSFHKIEVSEEKIKLVTRWAIFDKDSILLVSDNKGVEGFIYGVILKPFFSDQLIAQELALYGKGLRLIKEFEKEAKMKSASLIFVGSKTKYCDLRHYFLKTGYQFVEEQFVKEI